MYRNIVKSAKTDLNGCRFRSFLRIFSAAFFSLFFIVYCFTVVYLLVIDTDFVLQFDIMKNQFFLAAVCAAATLIGFILLDFAFYEKFKRDVWFMSFYKNITAEGVTVNFSMKILTVYILTYIKKAFYFLLFIAPSCIFGGVIYRLTTDGISKAVFAVLCIACGVIFIGGVISFAAFSGRYALVPLYLAENRDYSVKEIFKFSVNAMEGKCAGLFGLRIYNLPKRIFSLLIFPSLFLLPVIRLSEFQFALGKTNPYLRKKANTEKAVVFYFGNSVKQS